MTRLEARSCEAWGAGKIFYFYQLFNSFAGLLQQDSCVLLHAGCPLPGYHGCSAIHCRAQQPEKPVLASFVNCLKVDLAVPINNERLQRQTAVAAYLKSEQLPLFVFEWLQRGDACVYTMFVMLAPPSWTTAIHDPVPYWICRVPRGPDGSGVCTSENLPCKGKQHLLEYEEVTDVCNEKKTVRTYSAVGLPSLYDRIPHIDETE